MNQTTQINPNEIWELNETTLQKGISIKITLSGTSMLPFFRQGDEAIIKQVNSEQIKTGDIIIFRQSNKYLAHRLIKTITNNNINYVLTKGDSCNQYDEPIISTEIIGKIISVHRKDKIKNLNSFHWKTINKFMVIFSNYTHYLNSRKISFLFK